jgi:hypothetical protein
MSEIQRYRNAVGQLTKANHDLVMQRVDMQADLRRQRQDMQDAMAALDRGEIRLARELLAEGLAAWERKRAPRKGRAA